jgi:hypothetical protein
MAQRGRPIRKLNDRKATVVHNELLKENPEGFSDELPDANPVVLANHIPEYRMVQFLNGRDSGFPLEFHYSTATHPLKQYKLLHGKEYNLPVEVIEHLEQCNVPEYGYREGADGLPEMYVKGRKYLYQLRAARKVA